MITKGSEKRVEIDLYSNLADICTRFYDLLVSEKEVADFVKSKIEKFKPKKLLFVGGFFLVAKRLSAKYDITVVDYTDEMVVEGKKRLPGIKVLKADVQGLPFKEEFDAILIIGRVFTHMLSDENANRALQSIRRSLKPNGTLLFDNYQDDKITKTNYFNGKITVKDSKIEITRNSSTELVSKRPFIVNWKAKYIVKENGKTKEFYDEMRHRAFSRLEIKQIVERNGFVEIESGENFDETSFYTVCKKQA